jgi:hypothetical protein
MTTDRHFTPEELSAWLDGELDLGPERQGHLKGCPACSGALTRLQALRRTARAATPPVPTDRMWREIDRRTAGTAPGRGTAWGWLRLPAALRGYRLPVAGLGTALAALLVIVIGRPRPEPMGVPVPPAPATEASRPPAPAPLQQVTANEPNRPAPSAEPGTGKTSSAPERSAANKTSAKPVTRKASRADDERDAVRPAAQPEPAETAGAAAAPAATQAAPPTAALVPAPAAAPVEAPSTPPAADRRKASASTASRAPSAALDAATPVPAPARVTWRGKRVVITADRETRPAPDRIVLTGHVVILPALARSPYLATLDGLTRTLAGQASASMVEIHLPGEELTLKR